MTITVRLFSESESWFSGLGHLLNQNPAVCVGGLTQRGGSGRGGSSLEGEGGSGPDGRCPAQRGVGLRGGRDSLAWGCFAWRGVQPTGRVIHDNNGNNIFT